MVDTQQYTEAELRKIARSNRWILRFSRRWLWMVMGFLFLYTGLALMPPVLMETGHDGAANVIHKIYGPMCHQFAFRSWFFFGDQMVYPREAAGTSLGSFEEYAAADSHFAGVNLYEWSSDMQLKARSFTGNEHMGYKTALCERDVAIYGVMFLMGLLFTRVRKWLRPVPIWLYLLLGLVPLGLDGFSQMFGYPPFEFWPVRETLPAFRVLTGALFGLMNVWLAFPHLEASMQETQNVMGTRLALVEQRLADLQAMAE